MKKLFIGCSLVAAISLVLFAQPNRVPGPISVQPIPLTPTAISNLISGSFIPTSFGSGTNNIFSGTVKIGANTNLAFTELGTGELITVGGVPVMSLQPGGVSVATNLFASAVYPTLTNAAFLATDSNGKMYAASNFPNSFTYNFNGKTTFNSNVYVMNLHWFTNASSTITIDVFKQTSALATNNNISITGFTGFDGTNSAPFTYIFTNTAGSAAVKTITLPAGTLVLSSPFSTTIYNTNQGVLSGIIYPGFGTNVSWTGN